MADPNAQPDDLEIALSIMEGNPDGLRSLIRVHGPKVKGWLKKQYRHVLDDFELDEAFNTALQRVWKYADRYDDRKGKLASWFLRIARNAALSILRREQEESHHELEYEPSYDPADDRGVGNMVESGDPVAKNDRTMKDLDDIIRKLPPLQQAIINADLAAAADKADSARLAEMLDSSKNSIEVSRNKARTTIREEMLKRGHFQDKQRTTR